MSSVSYPIQIIAFGEVAQQALELAELTRFDETLKIDIDALAEKMVSGYRQILVFSALQSNEAEILLASLKETEDPVVILPESYKESEVLKFLLLGGIRIILAPSNSLMSVSLSQALRLLEALYYGNDPELEVIVEHEDIYTVISQGTVTELHESNGANLSLATFRVCNEPKGYENVEGAYVLYYIQEELPIMEIAEAMDAVESRLPEDAGLIFGTRNQNIGNERVKIVCMLSRRYDFKYGVSEQIEQKGTYMEKISVLVDAFATGEIDEHEAEYLAGKYRLDFKDVGTVYNIAYTQPETTVRLIERLHDSKTDLESKIEMLADAVYEDHVNITIAEGLVNIYGLSIESVLEAIRLKQEGKIPIHDINLSDRVKDEFPDLILAKNEDTVVLLTREEPKKERSGILSVDTDGLTLYKKNDVEWLVSKKIAQEDIDRFIEEYQS